MKKFLWLSVAVFIIMTTPAHAETVTLKSGWHLVSSDVMLQLDKDRATFINLLKDGAAIFGLNPVDKKYYGGSGNIDDVDVELGKMFQMIAEGDDGVYGMGWWFYAPYEVSIPVSFSVSSDDRDDYEMGFHFRKGWNLVSITEVMKGRSLLDVKGSCMYVSVYNFENGEWYKQTEADIKEKFTTDSLGHALAIKVENDCSFNFGKTVPSVPSLPQ